MLSKHTHSTRLFGAAWKHLPGSRSSFVLITCTGNTRQSLVSERAIPFCVLERKTHPSTLFSTEPLHTLSLIHCHLILPPQSRTVTKAPVLSMLGIGRVSRLNCSKTNLCRLRLSLSLLQYFILIYKLMFKKSRGEVVFNRGWFR